MNPHRVVKRDSKYYVTSRYSPEELGPLDTENDAFMAIRDDYDACHMPYCAGDLDWYGRCTNCGSNGGDL